MFVLVEWCLRAAAVFVAPALRRRLMTRLRMVVMTCGAFPARCGA